MAPTMRDAATRTERKLGPSRPKLALAATHPSLYTQPKKGLMPPPPPALHKTPSIGKTKGHDGAGKLVTAYPTPSPSPPKSGKGYMPTTFSFKTQPSPRAGSSQDPRTSATKSIRTSDQKGEDMGMPWKCHTDPTFTTSDAPVLWSRNHTVLKADTSVDHGNVISPTYMHGLPFGSMTEAAHHYPSEERLAGLY